MPAERSKLLPLSFILDEPTISPAVTREFAVPFFRRAAERFRTGPPPGNRRFSSQHLRYIFRVFLCGKHLIASEQAGLLSFEPLPPSFLHLVKWHAEASTGDRNRGAAFLFPELVGDKLTIHSDFTCEYTEDECDIEGGLMSRLAPLVSDYSPKARLAATCEFLASIIERGDAKGGQANEQSSLVESCRDVLGDPQYVTLDQMAAAVNRSKDTLERRLNKPGSTMPRPDVEGGGGKAHEWRWDRVRQWLMEEFKRPLPVRFFLQRG